MNKKALFKVCKELGCCDICCLRYMGYKKQSVYIDAKKYVLQYQDEQTPFHISDTTLNENKVDAKGNVNSKENTSENHLNVTNSIDNNELENMKIDSESENAMKTEENSKNRGDVDDDAKSPPSKKRKINICVSCLGVLQEEYWEDTIMCVKDVLEKKRYESGKYTCGLSAPICTLLREKLIALNIENKIPDYDSNTITQLKDAWKMTFREKLAPHINKTFDTESPLLITLHFDYIDDLQELEVLKNVSPALFESRSKQKRRFPTEFTRQSTEQALDEVSLSTLTSSGATLSVSAHAQCVSVACAHEPQYLGGRYIKLSRNLPQSPWVLEGRRVLPTSVQEIIFEPIASIYNFSETEVESRLKFIAAGREDVDVRCLGDGRPFAIEISDPLRQLKTNELSEICEKINKNGDVIVRFLTYISKDDLTQLKKGEETKSKTYEALCIKLTHSKFDDDTSKPVEITEKDLDCISLYRNTEESDPIRINISQKTPIRVLHRRPLLTRSRHILDLSAKSVPNHPNLFLVNVVTSAGTYVKEWVHGELARTRPSLSHILQADIDLLALDVTRVHLEWPPNSKMECDK